MANCRAIAKSKQRKNSHSEIKAVPGEKFLDVLLKKTIEQQSP
jgi:hypothetical protein